MTPLAGTTLPQNTGSGYVAAAYIVFFAIVLIYVAIMALRLSRVERGLRELHARTDRPRDGEREPGGATEARTPPPADAQARGAQAREPETQMQTQTPGMQTQEPNTQTQEREREAV